ncbi:MAG TPA: hypothetical protein ENH87_07900 [Pricia antarctica]|uniref:Uncharacterized protein n=1 Tax=Pricia antarctica TaxID=641691 RepID=A0A831QQC7_9FLAO|nr:hypothetical protein [Pricia antarctica]
MEMIWNGILSMQIQVGDKKSQMLGFGREYLHIINLWSGSKPLFFDIPPKPAFNRMAIGVFFRRAMFRPVVLVL